MPPVNCAPLTETVPPVKVAWLKSGGVAEVPGDGADDGEPDLPVVGELFVGTGFSSGGGADGPGVFADHGCQQRVGGVVGQPEVAAEDVDALLPFAGVYATAALADTWEQH